MVRREPVGVVVAITPFNYPITLLCFKLGAALIAGCTVVAKPSEDTPLSTLRMAEVFHNAGLPSGVFNVVTGARALGEALVVFGLDAGGQVALRRQEGGGVHLPPVRGQPLDAEHQMGGVLAVLAEVLAHAGLHVPEGRDRAAVERLEFSLLQTAAERLVARLEERHRGPEPALARLRQDPGEVAPFVEAVFADFLLDNAVAEKNFLLAYIVPATVLIKLGAKLGTGQHQRIQPQHGRGVLIGALNVHDLLRAGVV